MRPRAQVTPGLMIVHSTIFQVQLPNDKTNSALSTCLNWLLETMTMSVNAERQSIIRDDWLMSSTL